MDFLALSSGGMRVLDHHRSAVALHLPNRPNFRAIKQLGFVCFSRKRSKTRPFSLRVRARSFSDANHDQRGSSSSSTDGSAIGQDDQQQEEEQPPHHDKGQLIGTVRDSSGSIVAFRVFSQPQSGENELLNLRVNGTSVIQEEKEAQEEEVEKEKQQINDRCYGDDEFSVKATRNTILEAIHVEEKIPEVFVDHPAYHRPGNPYGDNFGAFGDNQFRFTLLCHAACEAPLVLPLGGYTYGEKCLFLVNDWHAGLVPVLLAAKYRPYGVYKDARSILVIHNLFHQGVEPASTYNNLGLPPQWYGALEWVFPEWARAHALDKGEAVNILKGAIVTSDRILTVSKGYSWEITTVEGGYGLHELLTSRQFVLNGIVNGIDTSDWNPSTDEHIAAHYSVDDLSGKGECKAALQKELGLPLRLDCPLIGFIGRLDYQKGIDLIQAAVPELMQHDVQFVMLGSGNPAYEAWMKATEGTYRDKFRGWVGFNVPISHRITAGCDILLMPSRFEPCGLNQLYAMRYGTVPVVHATGGLRDTVETYNPYAVGPSGNGTGTGWAFSPLTKESMLSALLNALVTYREYRTSWEELMKRGMQRDSTWDSAAAQYEQELRALILNIPMMSDLDLVRYACIAHRNRDSSESTILAEFNSADSSLQDLAYQCLHKAPPHHSIFSHSYRNQTYTFLLDDPFVYFGIFGPKMPKPDQILFLGRLRDALSRLIKLNPNKKFTSHCFQGELHPIFLRTMKKSIDLDPLLLVPNGVHSINPLTSVSGSVSPSSKARKIFSVPVLSPANVGKGYKKKRPSGEREEALVNGKFDVFDVDGVVGEVKSRKVSTQNGLHLSEAGGGGGRQKAKKIWRRHVWIVLALDLAVCLILFGIWLFVCRGLKCIEK
ncbi:hypothetical protein Cgig2_028383 [Carnegiea gigantea]|uniref:Starch synthase, chloroplastic/amyloplastic n=1 Tax=Carnegiea gigantea TaxID=171969 RepID=A0A9Q1K2H5_9CARY|nr:hypothetical protein Cgig2_028383 [Carnegiea gigantea]